MPQPFLLWRGGWGIIAASAEEDFETKFRHVEDDEDVNNENAPAEPVGMAEDGENFPREVEGAGEKGKPLGPIAFVPEAVGFGETDGGVGDHAEGKDPQSTLGSAVGGGKQQGREASLGIDVKSVGEVFGDFVEIFVSEREKQCSNAEGEDALDRLNGGDGAQAVLVFAMLHQNRARLKAPSRRCG